MKIRFFYLFIILIVTSNNIFALDTPVVSISGNWYLGEALTGIHTVDNTGGTIRYQWYRASNSEGLNEEPIDEATNITYLITSSDLNKHISLVVIYVSSDPPNTETVYSSSRRAVLNKVPVATLFSITGNMYLGITIIGNYKYSDLEGDPEGVSTLSWYRADNEAGLNEEIITDETQKTYTITSADLNKYISFKVIPVALTGTTPGASFPSSWFPVLNEAPKAGFLTIQESLYFGTTVTAKYTYSDLEGNPEGSSTFSWYRADNQAGLNEEIITGETQKAYTITSADLNKYISFKVVPVALAGTNPGASFPSSWFPVINEAPKAGFLTIQESLYFGTTATAKYTYSDLEGNPEGISTFEWYWADNQAGLNEMIITGETQKTYTITSANLNKYISFKVVPVALAGTTPGASFPSSWFPVLNEAPKAGFLTIQESLYLGTTATAKYTYSDLEGNPEGASTISWYRADNQAGLNEMIISEATQKTYTITSADLNKYISFQVTPVATTGTANGTDVRSARYAVLNAAPVVSGLSVTGNLYLGQTITGNYNYSDLENESEGNSAYAWYRSDNINGTDVLITGASQKTYILTNADLNKYISFEVTPVAISGSSPGAAVRSLKYAVLNEAPIATSISIGGSLYLGNVVTGKYTYTDLESDLEGNSTYTWYRADNLNGPDVLIVGAIQKTYTISIADINKYISFEVNPIASTGTNSGILIRSPRVGILNAVPVANTLSISGIHLLGQQLTGNYSYSDLENDIEGASNFAWYRSDNINGPDVLITGAIQKIYIISNEDINKFLSFEVKPLSLSGSSPGIATRTSRIAVLNEVPVASEVSITGNLYILQTITANYKYVDLEGDPEGSSIYKWYVATNANGPDVLITGASERTYTIRSEDLNKYISCEITPVAASGNTTGLTVRSSRFAVLNAVPVVSSLSVTGNRYLSQTVSGNYNYTDLEGDSEGISLYQWYISDDINGIETVISGATQKTFVITNAYLNKYISFEVKPVAVSGSLNGITVRSARFAVLNAIPSASLVSINGSFKIGQVLQGVYTYTDLEDDQEAFSGFNWYRANSVDGLGKTQIIGANTKNYVVQSIDMNKYIIFEVIPVAVTGSLIGNAAASPYSGPVSNSAPKATNVRITGTQAVCKTLRGEYNYEDLEGDLEGATAFSWLRASSIDGLKTKITGAIEREYTLTPEDQGRFIFFEVLPRAVSGTTTGVVTIGNPTGTIVNLLPTVTFLGTASICNGSTTKLTISFTGSSPWKLSYSDGSKHHQLVSSDPIYLLNVSNSGIYKGDTLVDNINCPVTNLPSSATISILPLPQVEIVGLNSAYNLRNNPVPLVGNPLGGTFSGAGVVSSTNMFYPLIAGTLNSPHAIIYEYKSLQTGCSNRDTVNVEIIDADASITGLRSAAKYCNFDQPFTVTGTNILGTTGTFTITGGIGLTDNHDNTATINPSLLAGGNYSISYSYTDGVQLTIFKEFSVEVLDQASIFGLSLNRYCSNNPPLELSGNYSGGIFTGDCVVKNSITNKYYFNPSLGVPGQTNILYSYTTTYGCVVSKAIAKAISSVPDVNFTIQNNCFNGDSIIFNNLTIFTDLVVKWDWRFGDLFSSESANRSNLFAPKHKYSAIGSRNVRLIAENKFGCKDTLEKIIHLGDIPVVDFSWQSECFEIGKPILFVNKTTNVDQIMNYYWDIQDTSKINFKYSTSNVSHSFPTIKDFKVKLKVTSEYGCSDSIFKIINLRPVFNLTDLSYTNNFETGKGFWFATDSISENNWFYGIPNGNKIKTAFDGSKAYYTSIKSVRKNQQMIITSPCFDFTKTKRPFISLGTFSDAISGQEGAVLQYTKDEGAVWENVGSIGSGTKWFNDYSILSQPGFQQIGWSGRNNNWSQSSHDLDFLRDIPRVRFRIVFGQSSKVTEGDGFALDNIFIGNRSKTVLYEHFTNYTQPESKDANQLLGNLVSQYLSDAVAIQYHTSFPGVDTLNLDNTSDPGSRVLYYGVGKTPFTLLDGGTEPAFVYDYINNTLKANDIKILSLKGAGFQLDLHITKTMENVTGSIDIKAMNNIPVKNLSARIVVVEDIKSQIEGVDLIYKNVVKKILPSAGGTSFAGNWNAGEIKSINFSWTYKRVYNPKNIHIVAFLQDELTHEIYQVCTDDTSGIIDGINYPEKDKEKWDALVYPNPANDWVNIDFPETKAGNLTIQIYTLNGKSVLTEKILKGVTRYELNTGNLNNGIYLIRILNKDNVLAFKKLVVLH